MGFTVFCLVVLVAHCSFRLASKVSEFDLDRPQILPITTVLEPTYENDTDSDAASNAMPRRPHFKCTLTVDLPIP